MKNNKDNIRAMQWRKDNPEKAKENRKRWYLKNKENIKKYHQKEEWKEYSRQYSKEYRKKHREQTNLHSKRARIKRHYGITLEQFEQMIISQNNKCAICGKDFINTKDRHIDHNHKTNKTRQILCKCCNLGIGYFEENPELMIKAIDYIKKWNTEFV